MYLFSSEITSSKIPSDNPLYQRTLKAYHLVSEKIHGNVLEIGCGEGYGLDYILKKAKNITVIDKSNTALNKIKKKYPEIKTLKKKIPPLTDIQDNSFDTIISFQVIEHVKDANLFIKEIHRILKPNGTAYITTPNALKTVARNPWHYKEYTFLEIEILINKIFNKYSISGIEGNVKTENYYTKNNKSVKRFLKIDVLHLHKKLPSIMLRVPFEITNRINRKRLHKKNISLTNSISLKDYTLNEYNENTLDLFCVLNK